MSDIPDDILRLIFSRLSGHDLARAACVCAPWRRVLAEEAWWVDRCRVELAVTSLETVRWAVGGEVIPASFAEAFRRVGTHLALWSHGLPGDPGDVPMRMARAFNVVREAWSRPADRGGIPRLAARLLPGAPPAALHGGGAGGAHGHLFAPAAPGDTAPPPPNELFWLYAACAGDAALLRWCGPLGLADGDQDRLELAFSGFFGSVVCYGEASSMTLLPYQGASGLGLTKWYREGSGKGRRLPWVEVVGMDARGTRVECVEADPGELVPFAVDAARVPSYPTGHGRYQRKAYAYDRGSGAVLVDATWDRGAALLRGCPPGPLALTRWVERWAEEVESGVMAPRMVIKEMGDVPSGDPRFEILTPSLMPSVPAAPRGGGGGGGETGMGTYVDTWGAPLRSVGPAAPAGAGWGEHEWDGRAVAEAVTEGVRVRVSTLLQPEALVGPPPTEGRVHPLSQPWKWTYRVTMQLLSEEAQREAGVSAPRRSVTLTTRAWVIEDAEGREVDRVRGPGVVGMYPTLVAGGDEFAYQSANYHRATRQTMRGHLLFTDAVDRWVPGMGEGTIEVEVPPFTLQIPSWVR